MPKGRPNREKNAMNTIPRMISGIIIGRVETYSTADLVLKFTFVMPNAPSVPITPALKLLITPKIRVLPRASKIALSRNSSVYHLRENPDQTELSLLSLKEYRITKKMGTYIRKSKTPK